MRVLVAPNAFKNSLSATAAAEAICKGLKASKLDCSCECFPIGDGGDGTMDLVTELKNGDLTEAQVTDPFGRPVAATYGLADSGRLAIIGLAQASGLKLLAAGEADPMKASTYGTGQLILHALDNGAKEIMIMLGGSATVDCGAGLLAALGTRFLDRQGKTITALPAGLDALDRIDVTGIDKRLQDCRIIAFCDVENKISGEKGAAAVFGPQKGATADVVRQLEKILLRVAAKAAETTGKDLLGIKHGGAAGGTAAGIYGLLNAELMDGSNAYLELAGFDQALNRSDLLITGEGSIDEQSVGGKGPFEAARRAKLKNIPVIGLAGQVPATPSAALSACFDVLLPITNELSALEEALGNTAKNLSRSSEAIGNLLNLSKYTGRSA